MIVGNPKKSKDKDMFLRSKLKNMVKNVFFLELNKDLLLKDGLKISRDIPIPILNKDFVNEVRTGKYNESIPFKKIADGMVIILGCDSDFKYNKYYIDILKNVENIDAYIVNMACEFSRQKEYLSSIACFKALDKISDNHVLSSYYYADTLKEMALYANEKGSEEEYKIYYDLSYDEFSRMAAEFPDFPYSYYHLGYFDFNEGNYSEAIKKWETAYELTQQQGFKDEIGTLVEGAKDKMIFENGKNDILEGNIIGGLRILIPLIEKHGDWSEAKYYTALGYRKSGNFIKAKILLKELLDMGEDFSEIFNELGLCYLNTGSVEKSIECLEKAVEKKCDPGYLCNLGIAYYQRGNHHKAKENIDKAYKIDPHDHLTQQCKEWIDKMINNN